MAVLLKGTKVIYDGPAGVEVKDLMSYPYIFVTSNDETTSGNYAEITVFLPK